MKPVKCLHEHDFEGEKRNLFSDALASDRVTGVNSSDSSSTLSVLLWSKVTISASDRASSPYSNVRVNQHVVVKRQILLWKSFPKGWLSIKFSECIIYINQIRRGEA
ncbi:hypothetical protein TNCV_4904471 [Trichonephila clavipes]|nr:hypothetical protein TNCV_4904471 [Trichonephila clavipes]